MQEAPRNPHPCGGWSSGALWSWGLAMMAKDTPTDCSSLAEVIFQIGSQQLTQDSQKHQTCVPKPIKYSKINHKCQRLPAQSDPPRFFLSQWCIGHSDLLWCSLVPGEFITKHTQVTSTAATGENRHFCTQPHISQLQWHQSGHTRIRRKTEKSRQAQMLQLWGTSTNTFGRAGY